MLAVIIVAGYGFLVWMYQVIAGLPPYKWLPMRELSRREFFALGRGVEDADPLVHIASLLVQATEAGCAAVRSVVVRLP